MRLKKQLPGHCAHEPSLAPTFDGRAWVGVWMVSCPGGLEDVIAIPGPEKTRRDTVIRYELEPAQTSSNGLTVC
jgi:hypothetical protein